MLLVDGDAQHDGDQACLVKQRTAEEEGTQQDHHSTNSSSKDAGAKPASPVTDISSVITQVTTRSAGPPAPYRPPPFRIDQPVLPRLSWKSKVRSLLCCFAPQSHGYIRATEGADHHHHGGGAGGRSHAPPVPPKFQREAIVGPKRADDLHKKTLILDLDETLVHSSFKPIPNPDYIIPVEIDGKLVDVYVLKRPWLDHFLETVGPRFEVVVFTASLAKYADPLLDMLDKWNLVRWRLFRESCCAYEGNYVKDLTWLGRELSQTIIVDNSPHSYVFQPCNAVPIGTFIDNMEDQELLEIMPILNRMEHVADVRDHLGPNMHNGKSS